MSEREAIQGAVAKIIDSRRLAINVGANYGVAVGMKFRVLNPKGQDITDPSTGAILGSLNLPKIEVKIIQVMEKLSLAETFRKITAKGLTRMDPGLTAYLEMLLPPGWADQGKVETLETKGDYEDLDEDDSLVKVGDPVIEIIEATPLKLIPKGQNL